MIKEKKAKYRHKKKNQNMIKILIKALKCNKYSLNNNNLKSNNQQLQGKLKLYNKNY